MTITVRSINGTLGGAIAIRNGSGEEHILAVFPDAGVMDLVMVGEVHCVAASRKRGLAFVDLGQRVVQARGRLSIQPNRIAAAPDGRRAIAYSCEPGLISVFDLPDLKETKRYNLIDARADGGFDLIYRDPETLKNDNMPWDRIPVSDGPFALEVRPDDLWLKHYPDLQTGLRRLRFTLSAPAIIRADGRAVIPFEFSARARRDLIDKSGATPLPMSGYDIATGIALIDLDRERFDFREIRRATETGPASSFPIRAINRNGTRAIVPSLDPVSAQAEAPSTDTGLGGMIRRTFGRKTGQAFAYGLEVWDIDGERPAKVDVIAYHPFRDENLLRTDTQRFGEAETAEAAREIALVMPGVAAAFAGEQSRWQQSAERQREDAHFEPQEARKIPAYRPAYQRVHYPTLFGNAMRTLLTANPRPFSCAPWSDLTDRQRRLLAAIFSGWSAHAGFPIHCLAWSGPDLVVAFGKGGMVREISLTQGAGPAWQLVDPAQDAFPFAYRDMFRPTLAHLGGRTFAADYYNVRFEFELPPSAGFGVENLADATPLAYRIVIDEAQHIAEGKDVDRLTQAIRPGYIKIKSKSAADIIDGLKALAPEVGRNFDQIVVDKRWVPSLFYRGSPVPEQVFCAILVESRSDEARNALDAVLTAFLDCLEGRADNVWHPDDLAPAMGPVAFSLIALSDPIPPSVTRFFARRDMEHDMWTPENFGTLALPTARLLAPDLLALQIRLAIQDICTGNPGPDLFALYGLPQARAALRHDAARAPVFAEIIARELMAQAGSLSWATGAGAIGVLDSIAEALDATHAAEVLLAKELRLRSVTFALHRNPASLQ
jgi:hypothetical protein